MQAAQAFGKQRRCKRSGESLSAFWPRLTTVMQMQCTPRERRASTIAALEGVSTETAAQWLRHDMHCECASESGPHLPTASVDRDGRQGPRQPEADPLAAQRGGIDLQQTEILALGPGPDCAADGCA